MGSNLFFFFAYFGLWGIYTKRHFLLIFNWVNTVDRCLYYNRDYVLILLSPERKRCHCIVIISF